MFALKGSLASRHSRLVLGLTIAAGVVAVVAATPSASIGKESEVAPAVRSAADGVFEPLGRGPALRVARAYDAENEDCTVVVTRTADASGHTRIKRALSCAN